MGISEMLVAIEDSLENLAVWKALEEFYEVGKLRAIGVSNFEETDLDNLLENAKVKSVLN